MPRRTLRSERSNRGGSSVVSMQSGGGVSKRPTAPVLAITTPPTNSSPAFTIDFDNTVAAGDNIHFQIQIAGGDWSAPVADVNHVITAPEDAANEVILSAGPFVNANYEARANVTHGTTSAWSNVVTFTISVVSSAITYYILGF